MSGRLEQHRVMSHVRGRLQHRRVMSRMRGKLEHRHGRMKSISDGDGEICVRPKCRRRGEEHHRWKVANGTEVQKERNGMRGE